MSRVSEHFPNLRTFYADAKIMVIHVGHSFGSALPSLIGITFCVSVVPFESPSERMTAEVPSLRRFPKLHL